MIRFQSSFDGQKLPAGRKGFISGGPENRTPADTASTLCAGVDVVRNLFEALWNDRDLTPEFSFRDEGKEFQEEPLGGGEFKIEEVSLEKEFLETTELP